MKTKTLSSLLILLMFNLSGFTQIIWTGAPITFTKADGADWTLQSNQDRITSNVWITRANSKGLFNIFSENVYTDDVSPVDTEWAYGTTANLGSLSFNPWEITNGSHPPSMVNQDMVVHLITDDIYIDIKFLSWSSGGTGGQGGFSYERSTDQTTGLTNIGFNEKEFVYPVPASEHLIIKDLTKISSASVIDLNGRKIMDLEISEDNILDISGLKKGMYFLILDDKTYTKFIKE